MRITIAQLEQEIERTRDLVEDAWLQRSFFAWTLASAWLAGSRARLALMKHGWIN